MITLLPSNKIAQIPVLRRLFSMLRVAGAAVQKLSRVEQADLVYAMAN